MNNISKKKETFIYMIGTIMVSVIGFIISIIYSHLFNPSDFGMYSLSYSFYSLISQLYFGWIPLSLLRNSEKYKNNSKKLYGSFFILHIIMSLLFFVLGNIINAIFVYNKVYSLLFFLLTIVFFFENQLQIINTLLRTNFDSKQYSINVTLNSLLKIIIFVILYYIFKIHNIYIILVSVIFSEAIQCLYLFFKLQLKKYYLISNFNIDIIKKMFRYGMPIIGIAITAWFLNVSDRFMIELFYSTNEVGVYSYSYNLANSIFSVLVQFIMLGAFPRIVEAYEKNDLIVVSKTIEEYLDIFFFIIIPSIFGVIIISSDFYELFTDSKYLNGEIVFIITSISISFMGFSQYTNKPWELLNNTKMLFILNLISAIVNVVLNFILLPLFGFEIAAYTTLVSYLIYIIISLMLSKKIFRFKINFSNFIKIIISSIIMLVLGCILNVILDTSIISLLVIIVISIICYLVMCIILKVKIFDVKKLLARRKI